MKKKESEKRYENMEEKSKYASVAISAVEDDLKSGWHDFTALGYVLNVFRCKDNSQITEVEYHPTHSHPIYYRYKVGYDKGKCIGVVFVGLGK